MDFHPSGNALAYCGTDNSLYIISAIMKREKDIKPNTAYSEYKDKDLGE